MSGPIPCWDFGAADGTDERESVAAPARLATIAGAESALVAISTLNVSPSLGLGPRTAHPSPLPRSGRTPGHPRSRLTISMGNQAHRWSARAGRQPWTPDP